MRGSREDAPRLSEAVGTLLDGIRTCATCHAPSGNGQSLVHLRAQGLGEGTWSPPTDLTSEAVVAREAGHIYNTIRYGRRRMPSCNSDR